jgi:hypothetical protein
VPHQLSQAAQAFKAQVMHALEAPCRDGGTQDGEAEVFRRGDIRPDVLRDALPAMSSVRHGLRRRADAREGLQEDERSFTIT